MLRRVSNGSKTYLCSNWIYTAAVAHNLGSGHVHLWRRTNASSFIGQQVITRSQNPFAGSSALQPLTREMIELTLRDAIERGIRFNLGLLLSREAEQQVRATRLQSLADILPDVSGSLQEQVQKINLQAVGFGQIKLPVPGFSIPTSVGPFSTSGVSAESSWNILDLHLIDNMRAANENVRAANLAYRDARQEYAPEYFAAAIALWSHEVGPTDLRSTVRTAVPVLKERSMIEAIRTPEDRFSNLPNYGFSSHYIQIDGLRMHYLDEGRREGDTRRPRLGRSDGPAYGG